MKKNEEWQRTRRGSTGHLHNTVAFAAQSERSGLQRCRHAIGRACIETGIACRSGVTERLAPFSGDQECERRRGGESERAPRDPGGCDAAHFVPSGECNAM